MNDILFYNSFKYKLYQFKNFRHCDQSHGIKFHCIARMRYGDARFVMTNGKVFSVTAGDVFYLPLGLCYESFWNGDTGAENRIEWESYGFLYFPLEQERRYPPQKLQIDEEATDYLNRLFQDRAVTPTSAGLLYLFLGKVLPAMEQTEADPGEFLMTRAKKYISEHPDFRVPDLARHCNVSESGLYAFFREYAHTTPIELKNQIQIERAISLLESTDLSVEEIASRLGFSSTPYFRRLIKHQTGKTPTEIKKGRMIL